MPISADAFDSVQETTKLSNRRRILEFLQAHRDQAFSQSELETSVHGSQEIPIGDTAKIAGIMISLEAARKIMSKEILEKGTPIKYYKAL